MIDQIEICKNATSWQQCLQQLPLFPGRPYYDYAYLQMLERNGEGEATALIYRQNGGLVAFYPFLLKKIPAHLTGNQAFFDIESPYGYGGPIMLNNSQEARDSLMLAHHQWCLNHAIVAEFTRFNPLTGNQLCLSPTTLLEKNRTTVSIDTSGNLDSILSRATPARRRNFNRARQAGLEFAPCSGHDFMGLYQQTMQNLDAESYYFFSEAYFAALFALKETALRGVFMPGGEIIAAAVFLDDELCRHYHLGASAKHLLELRPNDFLMFMATAESAAMRQTMLHLGGGLRDTETDQLFRFKKGFSPDRHEFFIGKTIHQPEIYRQISGTALERCGQPANQLLHYHNQVQV